MTDQTFVIAIDGPAGSGKSTIAKLVAKHLGLFYIDTGAMYRCLALKAKRTGVAPDDEKGLVALAEGINIQMAYAPQTAKFSVTLDGEDVSEEIRKPYINEHVSDIAKIKEVRKHMVELQRKLAEGKRVILEGRDITTVVFPHAQKRFYLDAKLSERIKRRTRELREKNIPVDEPDVKKDIEGRDKTDSTRQHAPLKRSPDARYIDTTHMSINEVVKAVIEAINPSISLKD